MNKYVHIGRLVADPELKVTPSGKNIVTFRCAIHRPFTKDKTDFFNYTAWGTTAERIARNFKKGSVIAITGHEEQERWKDSDGALHERHMHIVEEFDFCGKSGAGNPGASTEVDYALDNGYEDLSEDDDLPFN